MKRGGKRGASNSDQIYFGNSRRSRASGWAPAPAGAWVWSQATTTAANVGGNRGAVTWHPKPCRTGGSAHVAREAGGAAGFPSHSCPATWAWTPGGLAGRRCGIERCTRSAFRPGSRRPGPPSQAVLNSGGRSWRRYCSVRKTGLDASSPGIAMDGAKRIQGADVVVPGEPGTLRVPIPEMARAPEQAVETLSTGPVEPMHEAWQVGRLCRFREIVDVIAHETQGASLESLLLFRQVPERVNSCFRKGTSHVKPAPIQAALSHRMGGRRRGLPALGVGATTAAGAPLRAGGSPDRRPPHGG